MDELPVWTDKALRRAIIDVFLGQLAARRPGLFFLQIGAHDGVAGDPIHSLVRAHGWRGILVEPLPHLFDRLRENYRDAPGLIFERAAVSEREGSQSFYRLGGDGAGLPDWFDQLGSFDKEVVLKHRVHIPDIEQRLVEEQVPCVTVAGLLARHGVEALDLVVIDTEGYDWRVLRQVDLQRLRPAVVLYEKKHLNAADRAAARDFVTAAGYSAIDCGPDTIAVREEKPGPAAIIDQLQRQVLEAQELVRFLAGQSEVAIRDDGATLHLTGRRTLVQLGGVGVTGDAGTTRRFTRTYDF